MILLYYIFLGTLNLCGFNVSLMCRRSRQQIQAAAWKILFVGTRRRIGSLLSLDRAKQVEPQQLQVQGKVEGTTTYQSVVASVRACQVINALEDFIKFQLALIVLPSIF